MAPRPRPGLSDSQARPVSRSKAAWFSASTSASSSAEPVMRLSVKGLRSCTSRKKSSRVGGTISSASEEVVMQTLLSQVPRGSKRHDTEKHTQPETDVHLFSREAAPDLFDRDRDARGGAGRWLNERWPACY